MEQIKNEKTFFHVFPTLKVEEEFEVLFADVEVKKITTNSGRDFLHVHLKSHHLIPEEEDMADGAADQRAALWNIFCKDFRFLKSMSCLSFIHRKR